MNRSSGTGAEVRQGCILLPLLCNIYSNLLSIQTHIIQTLTLGTYKNIYRYEFLKWGCWEKFEWRGCWDGRSHKLVHVLPHLCIPFLGCMQPVSVQYLWCKLLPACSTPPCLEPHFLLALIHIFQHFHILSSDSIATS